MNPRVEKLRTAKEAESLATNAERAGHADLAREARERGAALLAEERIATKARQLARPAVERARKAPVRPPKAKVPRDSREALFLNGVFESVLQEILTLQVEQPDAVAYLQPYKPAVMKGLQQSPPSREAPWKLYVSTTKALALVGYEAEVVEWFDKASLSPHDAERIDRRITQYQPSERGLHLAAPGQAQSANLLGIVGLKAVVPPIAVAGFTKISDNLPLGDRTRSGGWSYVVAPAVRADFEVVPESVLRAEEAKEAKRAAKLSRDERRAALLASNPMPERVSVLTTVFRRNQLVILEVLERAGGVCEGCGRPAPFLRASDGTPYLEVHHLVTLANGGPDTVTNAIALCPNCHRQRHSGQVLP